MPRTPLFALLLAATAALPAFADGRFGQSFNMPTGDYDKRWHCVHRGQVYSAGAVVQMDGATLRCTSSEQVGFGESFRYATWVPVQLQEEEEAQEPSAEMLTPEELEQMRQALKELHTLTKDEAMKLQQRLDAAAPIR